MTMRRPRVKWDALAPLDLEHLLEPGLPFSQAADDLLRGTLVMSPTGGGKSESIINHVLHWLVELQETSGTGGLVIDPVGGPRGSLNLEDFCDGGVFAADKGAMSARFNPLRAGGAGFAQSLWRPDELLGSSDGSFYMLVGLRFTAALANLLLWAEAFIADEAAHRGKLPAYPAALLRASVNTLMDLLSMNRHGESAAAAIDALLDRAKKMRATMPEALDLDVFHDHRRAMKSDRSRSEQLRSLTNTVNRLYQLRAAYQSQGCDLLDDDPSASAITIKSAVEGGQIVGLRLPTSDGFPRVQLARCVLKSFSDQVLARRRPGISTALVLDEAAVFADQTMSELLAQGRKCGAATILAFQTREQFAQSENLLVDLWHNAINHWLIPPLAPDEAAHYEEVMGAIRYSRLEKSVSYAQRPEDEQYPALIRGLLGHRHAYTSHSVYEREAEEPLYDRHWLSYSKHQGLFRGLTHGELKTGVVRLSAIKPPKSPRVKGQEGGGPADEAGEAGR
jgi:hypothetical protein